jgi:hypothetical protein
LLEGFCSGASTEADILRLLRCTFAAHQRNCRTIGAATRVALRRLRHEKGLIEPNGPLSQDWRPTHKGRAVYDSGLPLELGMRLYAELAAASSGVVLGQPLHLMYLCLLEHPFVITNWGRWGHVLAGLCSDERWVRV